VLRLLAATACGGAVRALAAEGGLESVLWAGRSSSGPRCAGARNRSPGRSAAELSDGTLRFLLWAAALLTPRPPELFVLTEPEPETSLHPELPAPPAAMIARAAARTQVVVVTHSAALRRAVEVVGEGLDRHDVELEKPLGETVIAGQGLLDRPTWPWPAR